MSNTDVAIVSQMENGEREILERMDRRLARLDVWLEQTGGPTLRELREDAEMSRISIEHQLALTRRLVERSLRTFARVDRALDENTRTLRSLRDSLTGGGDGPN